MQEGVSKFDTPSFCVLGRSTVDIQTDFLGERYTLKLGVSGVKGCEKKAKNWDISVIFVYFAFSKHVMRRHILLVRCMSIHNHHG